MTFKQILAQVLGLQARLAFAGQNLSSANNIKINPVNVLWRIEAMEKFDFAGASGSAMNNETIHLFLNDGTQHYFWANYNSTGVDPAESGTGHAVAIASGALDTAIADDFKTAIAAVSGFTAVRSGTVVTVCRTLDTGCGEVSDPTCSLTGVVMTQVRRGKDFNLGLLQGDVDPKFGPTNLTITAHQFGKTPLANFNQGFDKIELTTKLLETDLAKLKTLYKVYGGSVTGGSATDVIGAGTSVLGTNIMVDAARLIFKPVNAADNKSNFNIMLAIPVPGSLVFSGENPEVLEVTWSGFADILSASKINVVNIGDIYQTGLTA